MLFDILVEIDHSPVGFETIMLLARHRIPTVQAIQDRVVKMMWGGLSLTEAMQLMRMVSDNASQVETFICGKAGSTGSSEPSPSSPASSSLGLNIDFTSRN